MRSSRDDASTCVNDHRTDDDDDDDDSRERERKKRARVGVRFLRRRG